MLYLSRFVFPDWDDDYQFRLDLKRTCYNSIYPFFVLSERGLTELKFAPVTVLYGGNGSGKTTALNVIAEALSLSRNAPYNRSDFFGDYVGLCSFSLSATIPEQSTIVTSDDVFEYMLNVRSLSDDIDRERQELLGEWVRRKYGHMQMRSLDDYDALKDTLDARRKTQSAYVRSRIPQNVFMDIKICPSKSLANFWGAYQIGVPFLIITAKLSQLNLKAPHNGQSQIQHFNFLKG